MQNTVVGIFNLELEQFKVESEKTILDSIISRTDSLYQQQIQSLKEACNTKDVMISKILETIENLSSNKN